MEPGNLTQARGKLAFPEQRQLNFLIIECRLKKSQSVAIHFRSRCCSRTAAAA